jgi:hypothetical protein
MPTGRLRRVAWRCAHTCATHLQRLDYPTNKTVGQSEVTKATSSPCTCGMSCEKRQLRALRYRGKPTARARHQRAGSCDPVSAKQRVEQLKHVLVLQSILRRANSGHRDCFGLMPRLVQRLHRAASPPHACSRATVACTSRECCQRHVCAISGIQCAPVLRACSGRALVAPHCA